MIKITICPSCGNNKIKKVKRNWIGKFQGQSYTVPSLEFYECPDCNERVYDRQAMHIIEAYSGINDTNRTNRTRKCPEKKIGTP